MNKFNVDVGDVVKHKNHPIKFKIDTIDTYGNVLLKYEDTNGYYGWIDKNVFYTIFRKANYIKRIQTY